MIRRWPLLLLALPAGVATWSGWVGLGELTGFGPVKPLPGISDFELNTAITLPIGVEAYAAYALHAWLSAREVSQTTRAFAKWSALASLLLGMLGQVGYHLLAVSGMTAAPWQVTTIVSCLPVLVLGMGAALGHMLARDTHAEPAAAAVPEPVPDVPEQVSQAPEALAPGGVPDVPESVLVDDPLYPEAVKVFFSDVTAGEVPPIRAIKSTLGVGQEKAATLQAYLRNLVQA